MLKGLVKMTGMVHIISSMVVPFFYMHGRDMIEIVLFSVGIHKMMRWLSADPTKPLYRYAYVYGAFWFVAQWSHLQTVTHTLYLLFPATITCFIIAHQHTLQKNLIALRKRMYRVDTKTDMHWLDLLLRMGLMRSHQEKSLRVLIQRNDDMEDYLTIGLPLETSLTHTIADIIDHCSLVRDEQMMVINKQGIVCGVNAHWRGVLPTLMNPTDWHDIDTYYTINTDALVLYSNGKSTVFHLLVAGHVWGPLSAQHVRTMLIPLIMGHRQGSPSGELSKETYHEYTGLVRSHQKSE